MKQDRKLLLLVSLFVIAGAFVRVVGYAPQLAIGVFCLAAFNDRRLAFLVPLLSLLFSDLLIEALHCYGWVPYGGFYSGQVVNYAFLLLACLPGLLVRRGMSFVPVAVLSSPVLYFLLSNGYVWLEGGGWHRAYLWQTYWDGLPFLAQSLASNVCFGLGAFLVWEMSSFSREKA